MSNQTEINTNLNSAFESGYSNAAESLSKLTSYKVSPNYLDNGLFSLSSEILPDSVKAHMTEARLMLTTEIFGDATGKSYFLLSVPEFELLTAGVPQGNSPGVDLKEEFIKEVDNILSASVITHLSNILGFKMYGDIPILAGKVKGCICDIIRDDFNEDSEKIYVNSISFSIDNYPGLHPIFIWVIDGAILDSQALNTIAGK